MCQQAKPTDSDAAKKDFREQYFSNLCFLNDIITIPRKVDHSKSKKEKFEEIVGLLNEINKQLPSFVYIPSDGRPS